ncbi:MAG: isoprenyl transferase [Candidatus Omnitrophota bacterium]
MDSIPKHVAIIMDGNGRWAKKRNLPRFAGHKQGIDNIKEIIKAAKDLGIGILTLFAFSTENWSRPKDEVDMLMNSLYDFLNKHVDDLNKDNIRFMVSGKDYPVPEKLLDKIRKTEVLTEKNSGIILNLAFNYGSRDEIIEAVKKICQDVKNDKLKIEDINEMKFSRYLYTKNLPDPDFLIRTSGEIRISNFLLWQLSYAELYFTPVFWPDFSKTELKKAIEEYSQRQRRFGRI